MKKILLRFLLLFLFLRYQAVLAESEDGKIIKLPSFSMRLFVGQKDDVSPDVFEWPLIAATSSHLSRFIDMEIGSASDEPTLDWHSILKKISLDASLQVDVDGNESFPTGTVIKADFSGEAYFDNSNQATQRLTQSSIATVVRKAFMGINFWELAVRFNEDSILRDVIDVQIWVSGTDESDNARASDESRPPGSTPDSTFHFVPLTIAGFTVVIFLVTVGVIAMYAFVHFRHGRIVNDSHFEAEEEDERSKGSASTVECDILSDESPRKEQDSQKVDTVFSTEYWKDAWAQAAAQITPRPPRDLKPRYFARQPSAVKPNLSSIQEEEEWEVSSFAGHIQSLSVWMMGPSLNVSQTHVATHTDPSSSLQDRDGELEMTVTRTTSLASIDSEENSPLANTHSIPFPVTISF
jgi:hypothetical protein